MKQETRDNVDRRLARIEGQVKALRRMVGEDRYCIDIARQVQAARAALSSLESIILDDHIKPCLLQEPNRALIPASIVIAGVEHDLFDVLIA